LIAPNSVKVILWNTKFNWRTYFALIRIANHKFDRNTHGIISFRSLIEIFIKKVEEDSKMELEMFGNSLIIFNKYQNH
jgi:hypothetical protein